ncbi:MAG: nascent polypeptide-associated complex protein [Candidatus Woesearchaeota archaeon]
MPNVNPRMMKQAMKKMGMKQEEIEATEVIIKTPENEIVITEPQVSKVNMMGQDTYQVVGQANVREKGSEDSLSEEDVKTVAEQAGSSTEDAEKALKDSSGDIAEAIMKLKGE